MFSEDEMDPAWEALPDTNPVPVHMHRDVDGCRWPIGDHPTLFCNAVTDRGQKQQYCATHSKLSYSARVTSWGNGNKKRKMTKWD